MITRKKINEIFEEFVDSVGFMKHKIDGIEYILINKYDSHVVSKNIFNDKTKFESLENHIHLIKPQICLCRKYLKIEIQKLGEKILRKLILQFPNHKFIVYIEINNKNNVIIRFHQQWKDEENYYNINNLSSYASYIIYCKN